MIKILLGTPSWVWLVFLYLLFIGIKSTRSHNVPLVKVLLIPIILNYITFNSSRHVLLPAIILMISAMISFYMHRGMSVEIKKDSKSLIVPGSYIPLFIYIIFFSIKYYFGYLNSVSPALFLKYSMFQDTIQGIFCGYLLGRTAIYLYKYFKHTDA